MSLPRLVLASGSPRRRELLAGLGLAFEVRPPEVDETPSDGEPPHEVVRRLAREKAEAAAREEEIVLAADTIVLLDGAVLGKPQNAEDACRMLQAIAGREHDVLTGVAVRHVANRHTAVGLERTRVRMAAMSEQEIAWYVGTGEALDKAGAYAIQGLGALLVESLEGNYTNVVGLPLPLVARLFAEVGVELLSFRKA